LKSSLVDPSEFDLNKVIVDRDGIMKVNPHRHELMLLDGICLLTDDYAVGFADISEEDFWVRGHFPDRPLMPGVLMCEAAAQLSAYYAKKAKLAEAGTVGLGGLDSIKFRGPVVPGDRLVLMLKRGRVRKNVMFTADFQGFVNDTLVVDGVIKGVVLRDPA
jgi:3-hydroxymyristoyl/3-hydroxydecanoyl-(acyl carrier protein) dehydratase